MSRYYGIVSRPDRIGEGRLPFGSKSPLDHKHCFDGKRVRRSARIVAQALRLPLGRLVFLEHIVVGMFIYLGRSLSFRDLTTISRRACLG